MDLDYYIIIVPYSATALSIIARFIFMFLMYQKKSTNSLSLAFCILNIYSNGMWIYYSIYIDDKPILLRSSVDIILLSISAIYIARNKIIQHRLQSTVLPIST